MIVADTNLLAYLLLSGEHTAAAHQVFQRDAAWAAPALWRSELRSVLVARLRRGEIGAPEAGAVMDTAMAILDGREYLAESSRVFTLAAASTCSAYDCEFVAVAQALAVPLVTADRDVLRGFPRLAVSPERFVAGRRKVTSD